MGRLSTGTVDRFINPCVKSAANVQMRLGGVPSFHRRKVNQESDYSMATCEERHLVLPYS